MWMTFYQLTISFLSETLKFSFKYLRKNVFPFVRSRIVRRNFFYIGHSCIIRLLQGWVIKHGDGVTSWKTKEEFIGQLS